MLISGIINMYYFKWDKGTNVACNIISIVITAGLHFALIGCWLATLRNE